MPSKKSKSPARLSSSAKVKTGCSESQVVAAARELAQSLQPGDRVLLSGPLGAGKSTFARAIIEALGADRPAEGSPTFPIAHTYPSARGLIAHVDLYRLKTEAEIEEAGLHEYFWPDIALDPTIVLAEWVDQFPDFERTLLDDGTGRATWLVKLGFSRLDSERDLEILRT